MCSNTSTDLTDARRFPFFNAFPHAPSSEAIAGGAVTSTQMLRILSFGGGSLTAGMLANEHYFPSSGETPSLFMFMSLFLAGGLFLNHSIFGEMGLEGHGPEAPFERWVYATTKNLAEGRASLWNRLGPSQVTRDMAMRSTNPFMRDYLLERLNR